MTGSGNRLRCSKLRTIMYDFNEIIYVKGLVRCNCQMFFLISFCFVINLTEEVNLLMWFRNHVLWLCPNWAKLKVLDSSDSHCFVWAQFKTDAFVSWGELGWLNRILDSMLDQFTWKRFGVLFHSGLWSSCLMESYASYKQLFMMTQYKFALLSLYINLW